jgi:Arc/MetJ family transcription regulator
MKTTIDIPERILKEAVRFSGASTERDAVLVALKEYNRRRRTARLSKYLGTFENFLTADELKRLREQS